MPINTLILVFSLFFAAYVWMFRNLPRNYAFLAISVAAVKLFVALTMGHLDIYRFIVFVQSFLANPSVSPWIIGLDIPHSDFPYPPLMLYVHSLFFFPFGEHLNLVAPYEPNALGYILIRIPFLIVDLIVCLFFVSMFAQRPSVSALLIWILSPVILFHQYYSGQFDLIVAALFFFFVVELDKNGASAKAWALLSLSFVLKPFAILYLPFVLMIFCIRDHKAGEKIGAFLKRQIVLIIGFVVILLCFKLLEIPYGLNDAYRAKMGAGGATFVTPKFLLGYGALLLAFAVATLRTDLKKGELFHLSLILVTLLFAFLVPHSAGWITWMVPSFAYLAFTQSLERKGILIGYWVMVVFFVARWALVPNSPVADSFDVFLSNYLNVPEADLFGMGYVYHAITENFDVHEAIHNSKLSERLFKLSAIYVFIRILWAKGFHSALWERRKT